MLLSNLAQRIRKRRKECGFTQAQLAEAAGVSPRFLAQLESGRGNISVQRLADIVHALGLSLGEIFRGLGSHGPFVLALVGLRGAGKSTLGPLVAEQLKIPFIELDQEIVREGGISLAEIFSLGGAEYYHELESRVLSQILQSPKPSILATGGSIVCRPASWEKLRNYAKTVWLQASPEKHLARVQEQGDNRPMEGRTGVLDEIHQLLEQRKGL
ncbi:MAG: shikimate kinase, partial [Myxococcota bacterium]|nr:shikimate kinase [Myxococcota bacterium]